MRTIPAELTARLQSGVTTLAHVWRLLRRDGTEFGFTDHDQPLLFDALVCEPMSGVSSGAIEKGLGLSVDTASIAGALNADAITEEDLAAGLWDGARVDIFRTDWRDPAPRVHLFAGHVGEVRRGVQAFEAELRGLQAALNKPVGRVFSRFCDANLGDARCGKDIETSALKGEGVVTALLPRGALAASGLGAFETGWFTRGRLLWDGGGQSEVTAHRIEAGAVTLELLDPPPEAVSPGAAFTIYAGCDKRVETCRVKFANSINFRGFPHMPGNDAVQAGPSAAEPLDGGSRFR